MNKLDSIVGFVGLLISVTTFLAQGPYEDPWKYLLAGSPLLLAALLILAHNIFVRFGSLRDTIAHLKHEYELLTGTNVSSHVVVRITNTDGDIRFERRFRYKVIKNGVTIHRTKRDLVGSEAPLGNMPPQARVLKASKVGTMLKAVEAATAESTRAGRKHFDYRWYYDISPALDSKGQYVEYEYVTDIPASEAKAFTDDGAVLCFISEELLMETDCTFISPPTHRIVIIKYHIEQHDGVVKEIPENEKPWLESNGHTLRWTPGFRKGASYVCQYKLTSI